MDLIAPLLTASPRSQIAVLTGYADVPSTNEALQLGAKVLLSKPGTLSSHRVSCLSEAVAED